MRTIIIITLLLFYSGSAGAESVYELRKLSEEDWLTMNTEERLRALATTTSHVPNQTFIGDFGNNHDLYKRWGYDFYEMEDRYESYAFRDFEAYNILEERRQRWSYNEFGDRIAKMPTSFTLWQERYSGDNTMWVRPPYEYINAMSTGKIDGVWVAEESTDDWSMALVAAGALRKEFTPLTLSLPNINGIALEIHSTNTQVSLVTSSLLGMHDMWGEDIQTPEDMTGHRISKTGGVMLRGGNIRRKFGALTLGATYANEYSVQGNREDGDEWFGTVNNYSPTPIYVLLRFLDDSPGDGEGGPIVYDVRLQVDGRDRPDLIPTVFSDNTLFDKTTAMTSNRYTGYLTPLGTAFTNSPVNDHMNTDYDIGILPKYIDYLSVHDLTRGYNASGIISDINLDNATSYFQETEYRGEPLAANGTEALVFMWDLMSVTTNVSRVRAVVQVANDYRIQTSFMMTTKEEGGRDTTSDPKSHYRSLYWRNAAQAEGNIRDGSNYTTVKLDFGYQVAAMTYGVNAQYNHLGFKISGEFVTNENHFMYADGTPGTGNPTYAIHGLPAREGHRFTERDHAYYVTAEKDWDRFGFGVEVFKMGKFYRPYLDFYADAYNNKFALSDFGTSPRNATLRMPLIEDNDDDDQYPDTDYVRRTTGFKIRTFADPDGVFPGNDEDNDGLPDTNRNNNEIPDYYEEFLMFDAIPDEFVFGDDFNNNTIPDFRENDFKYDTPYDLDRQGRHATVRFTPQQNIDLIVGTMRQDGVGRDWRTYNDYFKAVLNYDNQSVGTLWAEYRYQRIRDNIEDPYVRVETSQGNWLDIGTTSSVERFKRQLLPDILEYRNSRVNRLFIESKLRPIPSITIENLVKFEANSQLSGRMYDGIFQPDDALKTYSMINKVVYTKQWGDFSISPGINLRFYKKARDQSVQPQEHYLITIPLVMFRYTVSLRTNVQLGLQGFPGLEYREVDYVQKSNNYKRRTYLLQIENRSVYFGYDIWTGMGVKTDWAEFDAHREFENYKTSSTFLQMGIGW
jgi:hypothetical protein